mgnify:CR=1 FL=1
MAQIRALVWDRVGAAPKSALGIGSVIIALLVGFAPLMSSGWKRGFIVSAVVLAVLVVIVAVAQDSRDKRTGSELKKLRAKHGRCCDELQTAVRQAEADKDAEYSGYIAWLCKDRLAMFQHQIAACFAAATASERRAKIIQARTSILNATAELVGNVDKGTRANIFRLVTTENGSEEMVPDGFWGRGDQSTRVFRPGTATFDRAKSGLSRFRAQTHRRDTDTGEQLTYETYLTYPIREGAGKLYGVLTVDCLHEGELREDSDIARMSLLAAMLAMTFRAENVRPAQGSA